MGVSGIRWKHCLSMMRSSARCAASFVSEPSPSRRAYSDRQAEESELMPGHEKAGCHLTAHTRTLLSNGIPERGLNHDRKKENDDAENKRRASGIDDRQGEPRESGRR